MKTLIYCSAWQNVVLGKSTLQFFGQCRHLMYCSLLQVLPVSLFRFCIFKDFQNKLIYTLIYHRSEPWRPKMPSAIFFHLFSFFLSLCAISRCQRTFAIDWRWFPAHTAANTATLQSMESPGNPGTSMPRLKHCTPRQGNKYVLRLALPANQKKKIELPLW